jgi:integrase
MSQQVRLNESVESYLVYRQSRYAGSTVSNEGFVLRRFAAWVGDIQLRHLTAEKVEAWFYGPDGLMSEHITRDGIRREAIQPSTHNFYRNRLASFMRYATQRGLLRQDLLLHVAPMTVERKHRQQPSAHVLLALLDAAEHGRDRCYIATAINTGLRSNEITRLTVGAVDLDGGWLAVRITKSHDNDQQPITSDLDSELRRWLTTYAVEIGRPLGENDFLFPGRTGSRYVWRTSQDGDKVRDRAPSTWQPHRPVAHSERIIKAAMGKAGLPTKGEGTHTIRRAVARAFFDSMSNEVGYDAALRTVSALLHHKSSATTEHYLGLSSERKRRDERLRGKPFLTAMIEKDNVIPLRASEAL